VSLLQQISEDYVDHETNELLLKHDEKIPAVVSSLDWRLGVSFRENVLIIDLEERFLFDD
jgi:hypothetical protein